MINGKGASRLSSGKVFNAIRWHNAGWCRHGFQGNAWDTDGKKNFIISGEEWFGHICLDFHTVQPQPSPSLFLTLLIVRRHNPHLSSSLSDSGTKVNPMALMSIVLSWIFDQDNGAGMMPVVITYNGQFARWWRSFYEWNILHEHMVELVFTIKEIANLFSKIYV